MIDTTINFGGFYNSYHESIVERAVALMIGADDPDTGEIDHDKLYDFNDWEKYNVQYCAAFINKLNYELSTDLIFRSMSSPKEYNFRTDTINVDISKTDVLKLFTYIKDNSLKNEVFAGIKNATTSRDGYSAFYSYCELFTSENRHFLIEIMIDVILADLGKDYPFIEEDFYC